MAEVDSGWRVEGASQAALIAGRQWRGRQVWGQVTGGGLAAAAALR